MPRNLPVRKPVKGTAAQSRVRLAALKAGNDKRGAPKAPARKSGMSTTADRLNQTRRLMKDI